MLFRSVGQSPVFYTRPDLHPHTPSSDSQLTTQWENWADQAGPAELRSEALNRLRECVRTQSPKLDLSGLGLTSLPDNLPAHVTSLRLKHNLLTCLPTHLPSGLTRLDVSHNPGLELTTIPDGLVKLLAQGNGMGTLPRLPYSLEVCDVRLNNLKALPTLPRWLHTLDAAGNRLRTLPELPPSITVCDVSGNRLKKLPHLHASLLKLDVSENKLSKLPSLPHGLRELMVSDNKLTTLPPLPASLKLLYANENRLTTLKEIPASLEELDISYNLMRKLSASVMDGLESLSALYIEGNVWKDAVADALNELPCVRTERTREDEPAIIGSQQQMRSVRPLILAVAGWLPKDRSAKAVMEKWSDLSDDQRSIQAFSAFLDRLAELPAARSSEFVDSVSTWLTRLSADPELRDECISQAYDATQSCEDRVTLTWNQMQRTVLAHSVSQAPLDAPRKQLIQWSKEVYALEQLQEIAEAKTEALVVRGVNVDEIEVHLAYQVGLAEKLDLRTPIRNMLYNRVSGVSNKDLDAAYKTVFKAVEGPAFHEWLNNWRPWQSFLQRLLPEQYEQAFDAAADYFDPDSEAMAALLAEVKLIADVDERDAGQIAQRYILDKHLSPLTRKALAAADR